MNKFIVPFSIIFSLLIGYFIREISFDKEKTIKKVEIKNKKEEKIRFCRNNLKKEEINLKKILKLPIFIKEDLESYAIDTTKITLQDWEGFKDKLFLNQILLENSNVDLVSNAIFSNSIDTLKFLKENGIKIDIPEKEIRNIFYRTGYKMIRYLLENDLVPLDYKDKRNEDLISLTLSRNDIGIKKQILRVLNDYNLDISKNYSKYARAAIKTLPERKEEILENIDLTYRESENNFTLFAGLLKDIKEDDIDFLLAKETDLSKDDSILFGANGNKNISGSTMQKLIDNGADVNARFSKILRTPIMNAVKNSSMSLEKMEVLLKNGADLSLIDAKGRDVYDHLNMSFSNEARKDKVRKLITKYKNKENN